MVDKFHLVTDDGREWKDMTFQEFREKCDELDEEHREKAERVKKELDAITDVHTEIKKLLDLRKRTQETEERIRGLGYEIWENSPKDMFYLLRSRVFKALKLEMIAETPYFKWDPSATAPIQEWLIPYEDEDKVREAIEDEYERERREDYDDEE